LSSETTTEEDIALVRSQYFMARRRTPGASTVAFRCRDLGKSFRRNRSFLMENLRFDVRTGEITGILGVNGSGKSTLLRIIAGDLMPSRGTYSYPALYRGTAQRSTKPWQELHRKIAFVQQRPPVWTGYVMDYLQSHAFFAGFKGRRNLEEVDYVLSRLGLNQYRHSKWSELSGGFQMRVELARALVTHPTLLLLDEPLAPLDVFAQELFLQDLQDLTKQIEQPLATLISSQHLYEIEAVSDRMILLNYGKQIFFGSGHEVGYGRDTNHFQLECNLSPTQLSQLLAPHQATCHRLLSGIYEITAPITFRAAVFLRVLQDKQVEIRYFRDTSRSLRSKLSELRQEMKEESLPRR
jgi:ABC-2 type transport system ATP-binding protein